MSAGRHLVVDRPADHQVWGRAELVAGWIAGQAEDAAALRASCGGVALTVRPCLHPRGLTHVGLHGFWSELVLQRHLDAVRDGRLTVELFRDDEPVGSVTLLVTPFAAGIARAHPLDLLVYDVPPPSGGAVETVVFPGLGAVGGASLNQLARAVMLREDFATPVYDEANAPALWARVCARVTRPFRWIDGHACYGAVDGAARIALLRDPLRRIASVYNYGSLVHPERFAGVRFEEFVESGAARRSAQAIGLLTAAGRVADAERAGVALYRAAREALAAYELVGITEHFEETIFLLARLAGWTRIGMWRRVLAAPRLVETDTLPTRLRRRLVEDLAPDIELYEEMRGAFAARVAAAELGPALARYRAAVAREPELPAVDKAVECLRWRQVLADHAAGLASRARPSEGRAA